MTVVDQWCHAADRTAATTVVLLDDVQTTVDVTSCDVDELANWWQATLAWQLDAADSLVRRLTGEHLDQAPPIDGVDTFRRQEGDATDSGVSRQRCLMTRSNNVRIWNENFNVKRDDVSIDNKKIGRRTARLRYTAAACLASSQSNWNTTDAISYNPNYVTKDLALPFRYRNYGLTTCLEAIELKVVALRYRRHCRLAPENRPVKDGFVIWQHMRLYGCISLSFCFIWTCLIKHGFASRMHLQIILSTWRTVNYYVWSEDKILVLIIPLHQEYSSKLSGLSCQWYYL